MRDIPWFWRTRPNFYPGSGRTRVFPVSTGRELNKNKLAPADAHMVMHAFVARGCWQRSDPSSRIHLLPPSKHCNEGAHSNPAKASSRREPLGQRRKLEDILSNSNTTVSAGTPCSTRLQSRDIAYQDSKIIRKWRTNGLAKVAFHGGVLQGIFCRAAQSFTFREVERHEWQRSRRRRFVRCWSPAESKFGLPSL